MPEPALQQHYASQLVPTSWQQHAPVALPVHHISLPVQHSTPVDTVKTSSGSCESSPASPKGGFAFRCPLCTKPQYTPKSHCGHVRNVVDSTGYCHFRQDVPFHGQVLAHFGNASSFVNWYVQRQRSSVGQAFTDEDIQRYQDLQQELLNLANTGSL